MRVLLTTLAISLALVLPASAGFNEEVAGADFLHAHNEMLDGEMLDISAGGEPGGYWAWAEYTAPTTVHFSPVGLAIDIDNLIGSYWVQTYDWGTQTWSVPAEYTTDAFLPTGSCFWVIHVFGDDSVTIVSSTLVLQ